MNKDYTQLVEEIVEVLLEDDSRFREGYSFDKSNPFAVLGRKETDIPFEDEEKIGKVKALNSNPLDTPDTDWEPGVDKKVSGPRYTKQRIEREEKKYKESPERKKKEKVLSTKERRERDQQAFQKNEERKGRETVEVDINLGDRVVRTKLPKSVYDSLNFPKK